MYNFWMQVELMKKLRLKRELQKINFKIEKEIKKEKKSKAKQCKILIVGAAESGKSTFVKQLRVNNGDGFSQKEKKDAVEVILSNLVVCVHVILCNNIR